MVVSKRHDPRAGHFTLSSLVQFNVAGKLYQYGFVARTIFGTKPSPPVVHPGSREVSGEILQSKVISVHRTPSQRKSLAERSVGLRFSRLILSAQTKAMAQEVGLRSRCEDRRPCQDTHYSRRHCQYMWCIVPFVVEPQVARRVGVQV